MSHDNTKQVMSPVFDKLFPSHRLTDEEIERMKAQKAPPYKIHSLTPMDAFIGSDPKKDPILTPPADAAGFAIFDSITIVEHEHGA